MGVDIQRLFTVVFGIGAGAVRGRRRAARAAARGAGRHGREHPDPRLRRHRHRRHRLDPRRARRRAPGRRASTPSAAPCCSTLLREFLPPQWASAAGPAIASIAVYVFMAIVLASGRRACSRRAADGAARSPPTRAGAPRRPRWRCRRARARAALRCCAPSASTSTSAWPAGSSSSRSPRPASTSCSATAAWSRSATPRSSASAPTSTGDHDQRRRAERLARISPPRSPSRALAALADRRDLAAHARRLLHHDHARLRADAVLPRQLGEGLRRRRGPEHPRPLAVRARRSCSTCKNPLALYYVAARRARRSRSSPSPASRRRASAAPCSRCATTRCAPRRSASRPTATSWSSSSSPARSAASPAR